MTAVMDELDNRLVTELQGALPVAARPFDALAAQLGIGAEEMMARLRHLAAEGLIRRVGPVFDSRNLGYVSTLVAARIPADRLAEAAECVNRLEGVTHNYERRPSTLRHTLFEPEPQSRRQGRPEHGRGATGSGRPERVEGRHAYNLWFTLTAPSAEALEAALESVRRRMAPAEFHSLPAEAVYKIGVHFDLTGGRQASASLPSQGGRPPPKAAPGPARPRPLTEKQKGLVRLLQGGLPLEREPFAEAAAQLGWPVERIVEQIRSWLASGIIRRFGAVVEHRSLGFRANGMAVFRAAAARADEIGRSLAAEPAVSHCYRRPALPDFPYNLYAMVHGRSEEEVRDIVRRMAEAAGAAEYEVLFSVTEFKKSPPTYFAAEGGPGEAADAD